MFSLLKSAQCILTIFCIFFLYFCIFVFINTVNYLLYLELYLQVEKLIQKMQDEKNGVPVRTVKSFMSKVPSVFTG